MAEPPGFKLDSRSILISDFKTISNSGTKTDDDYYYNTDDEEKFTIKKQYCNISNSNNYNNTTTTRGSHGNGNNRSLVDNYKERVIQSFTEKESSVLSSSSSNSNDDNKESVVSNDKHPINNNTSTRCNNGQDTMNNHLNQDYIQEEEYSILRLPFVFAEESKSFLTEEETTTATNYSCDCDTETNSTYHNDNTVDNIQQQRSKYSNGKNDTTADTSIVNKNSDSIMVLGITKTGDGNSVNSNNYNSNNVPVSNNVHHIQKGYEKTTKQGNNEILRNSVIHQESSSTEYLSIITARDYSAISTETMDEVRQSLILSETPNTNQQLVERLSILRVEGVPLELALKVGASITTCPLRFFILDNSCSMCKKDRYQVRIRLSKKKDKSILTPCTRWTELQSTVNDHVKIAGLFQVSTIFRFLNDPGTDVGPQEFSIASKYTSSRSLNDNNNVLCEAQFHRIRKEVSTALSLVRRAKLSGIGTNLTVHLRHYKYQIEAAQNRLRANKEQALIVISTDNLPTDENGDETYVAQKEFIHLLKSMGRLPLSIVCRLCTVDEKVVEFYKSVQSMVPQLRIDILNDFVIERQKIVTNNPWLNYTLPMHRCREMGCRHRVFDVMSDRRLNMDELHEFFVILFGQYVIVQAPDIYTEWDNFITFLYDINNEEGVHWNIETGIKEHWINIEKLNQMFGGTNNKVGWPSRLHFKKLTSIPFEREQVEI